MDSANAPAVWAVTDATGLTPDQWGERWTTSDRLGFTGLALPIEALELAGPGVASVGGRITVLQATAGADGQWLGSTDPTRRADAVRHFIQQLTQASQAGAEVLTIRPAAPRMAVEAPDEYADALHALSQSLRALVGPVQRASTRIGVEVGRDGFLLSPLEARELCDRIGRPEIGASMDVTTIARIGSPVDWIRTLGRRLACVMLQASKTESASPAVVPAALATALADVQYAGPVVVYGDSP
ncbi:MAG: sugar phosphate isomerase/epimerase family protein [Phycisphaerae bacterium]